MVFALMPLAREARYGAASQKGRASEAAIFGSVTVNVVPSAGVEATSTVP